MPPFPSFAQGLTADLFDPPDAGLPGEAALALAPPLPADVGTDPEQLHPSLWRAHRLGGARVGAGSSGFHELDAELPGGGWPVRALTELLLPHPGIGEMRLLAPVLAAVQCSGRGVMLFDPPAAPCGWTLQALGLDLSRLVLVRSRDRLQGRVAALGLAADTLWALEQALRSGHAGAVLAWLPARLRADALRRLQLAAQSHDGPAFLMRDESARLQPSPAALRLLLAPAGADALALHLLKRRGPPCAAPLLLGLPSVLSGSALRRAARPDAAASSFGAGPAPGAPAPATSSPASA